MNWEIQGIQRIGQIEKRDRRTVQEERQKGGGKKNQLKKKKRENVAEKKGKLSLSCQMLHVPLRGTMANFNKIVMFSYRLRVLTNSNYSHEYISTSYLISTSQCHGVILFRNRLMKRNVLRVCVCACAAHTCCLWRHEASHSQIYDSRLLVP